MQKSFNPHLLLVQGGSGLNSVATSVAELGHSIPREDLEGAQTGDLRRGQVRLGDDHEVDELDLHPLVLPHPLQCDRVDLARSVEPRRSSDDNREPMITSCLGSTLHAKGLKPG